MVKLVSKSGTAGLPVGVKSTGRTVDFKPDDYIIAIESKGYRLAWSRASFCPCRSDNDQTGQPGINCTLCKGTGWMQFAPAIAVATKVVGKLDALQTQIVSNDAGVIFGVMTGITNKESAYDKLQRRLSGTMSVTVRPENKLGYNDRLVNLDTTIVYSQVEKTDGSAITAVRYPVVCMNLLRSEDQVFTEGTDFQITAGNIAWIGTPPAPDTQLGMHYLTYPHWRLVEHPHSTRATLISAKTKKPATPLGNPTDLPVQGVCQLEFLL